MCLGRAVKISGQGLALSKRLKDGLLDAHGLLLKTHVSQHHDGAEKKCGGVGKTLASDIRSRTVNGLEDGALITNVGRWGESKTTDESSAGIGQNVSVKVRHDQDLVVVWSWVGDNLQAGVVDKLGIKLDLREVLGDSLGGGEEKTIAHLHDGGLVDGADLQLADLLGVLESVLADTLRRLSCDELDALHDTVNDDVLNAGVFSLGVLSDENGVDVVVWGLESRNGAAGTHVGEEVECAAEGKVQGDVALANGCLNIFSNLCLTMGRGYPYGKWSLEGNLVSLDALNGLVGDDSLAILQARSNINWLPLNWCLQCDISSLPWQNRWSKAYVGSLEDVLH